MEKAQQLRVINMLNINIFGGPGVGKSTAAADIFSEMKKEGYVVELTHEYAKDLTYSQEFTRLSDQVHILGEQHHKLFRLKDKVDYTINDSPFILGCAYLDRSDTFPYDAFIDFSVKLFNSYTNLNILLIRDYDLKYQTFGRNQDLNGAVEKDKEIRELLTTNSIPFIELNVKELSLQKLKALNEQGFKIQK